MDMSDTSSSTDFVALVGRLEEKMGDMQLSMVSLNDSINKLADLHSEISDLRKEVAILTKQTASNEKDINQLFSQLRSGGVIVDTIVPPLVNTREILWAVGSAVITSGVWLLAKYF